jgi:hypothetical protein
MRSSPVQLRLQYLLLTSDKTCRNHKVIPIFSRINRNINTYVHRNSPTLHTSTLRMEAACTSQKAATLSTSTQCDHMRTELTSIVNKRDNLKSVRIDRYLPLTSYQSFNLGGVEEHNLRHWLDCCIYFLSAQLRHSVNS